MNTRLIAAPLAALALAGGAALAFAGTASAAIPNYPATITMTITNNTDHILSLRGADNPYGDWIVAPQQTLAPHATETVSASTWNQAGFAADVTYGISGTGDEAVFFANNYATNTSTDATRVDGANTAHLGISSQVNDASWTMTASYDLLPLLY